MTSRERNLLTLFFLVLGAALLVVGLGSYWEGLNRLDAQFVDLQKRVVRVTQTTLLSKIPEKSSTWASLKDRFFVPGTLPPPLSLASQAQAALRASGLSVLESRVQETSDTSQWVQYMAQGGIPAWFHFLETLRQQDPKALFRTLSLVSKQGSSYAMTFEVGHVVLP